MVNVIISPEFKITLKNQIVLEGSQVNLHCSADGYPKPTIRWAKDYRISGFDSSRFVQLSNGSLIIKKASPKDSGKYGCIAGNSNGLKRVEVDLLVRNLIDLIQLNISNLEKEKKLK